MHPFLSCFRKSPTCRIRFPRKEKKPFFRTTGKKSSTRDSKIPSEKRKSGEGWRGGALICMALLPTRPHSLTKCFRGLGVHFCSCRLIVKTWTYTVNATFKETQTIIMRTKVSPENEGFNILPSFASPEKKKPKKAATKVNTKEERVKYKGFHPSFWEKGKKTTGGEGNFFRAFLSPPLSNFWLRSSEGNSPNASGKKKPARQ